MEAGAPMRGNRRGFRRWIGLGILLLPVAVWLLVNLWLASSWGRHWLASKLQQRSAGLEVHVGGASASPWNGINLAGVELLQPPALRAAVGKPFARIESIRLVPVWRSWLRGRRELQSVELDSPHIVLPLEILSDLVRSRAPATPPPAVAAAPATAPPVTAPPQPPLTTAAPVAPPQPPPVPPPSPAITLPPTGWLRLKDASITLMSAASGKTGFRISGVSGSIPVSGSPAESTLRVASVEIAGQGSLTDLELPLDWKAPLLSMKPFESDIQGFKLTTAAKLGIVNGLPLQIEGQFPRQKPAPFPLPSDGRAEADSLAANARFRGFLLAPATWQGELVVEALAPAIRLGGHDAVFDRGSSVTVLRGGTLSCVDARLIGDELSVLGNATVLADGRCAAALRLVAPPESANAISRRFFPGLPQPLPLTPLSGPQRAAFDLEASGNIRQIFLRVGRDGPVVELKH